MAKWYVRDLSKLTGVSVQTLHHYDRIGLLKPSIRSDNGYRVYSEKDLLRLQQIIALKFFGFELSKVKALLTGDAGGLEHLLAQAQLLEQKAKNLSDAGQTLKAIISDVKDDKSIRWETIIKSIEVYNMTKNLEHSWVKEIFTSEELKQYATFWSELQNSTSEERTAFEKNWADLVAEIKANIENDPKSTIGITLGNRCMELINGLYGKKYAHLRTKMFERGFAEGKGLEEVGLTPETVSWLDKAVDAYWRDRIYGVLDQVGKSPSDNVLTLWQEVMDDMYGEDLMREKSLCDIALKDDKVSKEAKEWLRQSLKALYK